MKILAAGDLHGDSGLARELAEKADQENVDLVVLCGDITQAEQSTEKLVGAFKQKVLLVPGNHESMATADFLAERYNAKNLHGYYAKSGDVGLFGCGLANIGLFQMTENEIDETLNKGFKHVKECKKKIMVTHVHPSGTIMEKLSNFFPGSDGVRKAVEELKPDILFCSHVHEAEGMEEKLGNTRVINVGRNGKIIEI
jgi:Icc-related predicted phosphoesterase